MSVLLETPNDNDDIAKRTENWIALFDMTGYRPGLDITNSLPGLYCNQYLVLPETGES